MRHIAGQGEVVHLHRGIYSAVCIYSNDFTGLVYLFIQFVFLYIFFIEEAVIVVGLFTMFKAGGHKNGPSFFRAVEDHGQRKGNRLFVERPEMKFMTVANVFEDNFGGVHFLRRILSCRPCRSSSILRLGHIKKKQTN